MPSTEIYAKPMGSENERSDVLLLNSPFQRICRWLMAILNRSKQFFRSNNQYFFSEDEIKPRSRNFDSSHAKEWCNRFRGKYESQFFSRYSVIKDKYFLVGIVIFIGINFSPNAWADAPFSQFQGEPTLGWFNSPEAACQAWMPTIRVGGGYYQGFSNNAGLKCYFSNDPNKNYGWYGLMTQRQWCASDVRPDTSKLPALQCGGAPYWSSTVTVAQLSDQNCPVGNPIFPGTGIKTQVEIDFLGAGLHPLSVRRSYRTNYLAPVLDGFDAHWMHQWQRRLNIPFVGNAWQTLIALRGDGSSYQFANIGGNWTATGGQRDTIEAVKSGTTLTGWKYTDASSDSVEMYDIGGRLQSVTERNGWVATLAYSDSSTPKSIAPRIGLLVSVRNQFGQSLYFTYDNASRITTITAPGATVTQYQYDASGMLSGVIWADGHVRYYHYEDARFSWALTGITDEAGVRFATYVYDPQGRAISSEHAGGVDRVQLQYLSQGQTSVTSPDGGSRTYTLELSGDVLRATSVSAPCPECGNVARTSSYDAAGNISAKVDFDNSETRYSYDALGRETQRIEGYGTASAQTTTTEWHPTWRLPVKIASPGRVDYFNYDAKGHVIGYAWFPTNDVNGTQGQNATPSGPVTSNGWTFDANGLVTTTVQMVDDVATGQWSFIYDGQGNLATVTNAAGQTGTAVQYDAAGRLREAVDVNGSRIKYIYSLRGWLTDVDIDGLKIHYDYDAIGQRTAITGPQNLVTQYAYDVAHRLIQILDNITVTEAASGGGSSINPFASESASTTSQASSVSPALIDRWNSIVAWLKDWLSGFIKSAQAQGILLPNTYVPPLRPELGQPTYQLLDQTPTFDPSLSQEGMQPGLYVVQFLTKLQQTCTNAIDTFRQAFDRSTPPGDCDDNTHNRLRESVNNLCKSNGSQGCNNITDSRGTLLAKLDLNRQCALARTLIKNKCFRGGDGGHYEAERNAWKAVANCERILAQP